MRSLESWPAGPRGAAGAELGGGQQQQQGEPSGPGNKYVDPVADADAAASQRGFAEGFGAKVSCLEVVLLCTGQLMEEYLKTLD